jgi:hypothetical protein
MTRVTGALTRVTDVLAAVIAELGRSLKWRAKKLLGLSSVSDALTGAVGAVQRVDSALRLNVHFHILYLDGVYVLDNASRYDSPLTFHGLPTPSRAETADIAGRIADRVEAILKKHGRNLDPDMTDSELTDVQLEHPALAACYGAAALGVEVGGDRAGQPTLRLMSGEPAESAKDTALPDLPIAEVRGINLYGRQWVHGHDRKQLERLARTITRPPIAQERLTQPRRHAPARVQESLEGRKPRVGAHAQRPVGAPLRCSSAAPLSHGQILRCPVQPFRIPLACRA